MNQTDPADNPWIVRSAPIPQPRMRLFCFPYAGGGASVFRSWSDALPEHIEICPIQFPGRENRLQEPPFTRLRPLIQTLAQVLLPHLNMPFAFFGHSMGALASFELALELRRQNAPRPVHLFVSGCRAPQLPRTSPPTHQLPDTEFIDELRRFNGTPEAVLQNSELLDIFLPLLRADLAMSETYDYVAEEPLDLPISAFGGLHDDLVSSDGLAAWQDQTRSGFTLRQFPGDHFFLIGSREALLRAMQQDLSSFEQAIPGYRHDGD